MTEAELIALVYETTGQTEKTLPAPRIIAASVIARQNFANKIRLAMTPAERQMLRSERALTFTTGVGNLAALKSDTEPILAEEIYQAELYLDGETERSNGVPDRSSLNLDRAPGFPYHTVAGDSIYANDSSGDPFDGPALLTINRVPTLANIPVSIKDDFIEAVNQIVYPLRPQKAAG